MKKKFLSTLFVLVLGLSCGAEDSQKILERIDAYRIPYAHFLVRTKIVSFIDGRVDETAVFDAYISGQDKSLVIAR